MAQKVSMKFHRSNFHVPSTAHHDSPTSRRFSSAFHRHFSRDFRPFSCHLFRHRSNARVEKFFFFLFNSERSSKRWSEKKNPEVSIFFAGTAARFLRKKTILSSHQTRRNLTNGCGGPSTVTLLVQWTFFSPPLFAISLHSGVKFW